MTPDAQALLRKEAARWTILQTIHLGGHIGVTESMVLPVLRAEWLSASREFLRNEIDYLERRGLVTTERPALKPWRIQLTRAGQDVVEYTADCEPGIARPAKYWGGA